MEYFKFTGPTSPKKSAYLNIQNQMVWELFQFFNEILRFRRELNKHMAFPSIFQKRKEEKMSF